MLSKRAQHINPSPTLGITAKAKEMKKNGIDVITLAAGEPDFDTPEYIKDAAKKAIDDGFTKYTPTSGIPELKKAICEKFKKDNNLEYAPNQILVSCGAKQCLYDILQVLVNPGDEVIIPVPYWVSYEEMVKLAEGKCVFLKTKQFKLDPGMFKKAIGPKTKALILNSPSNPTGAVYSLEELKEIAKICEKNNMYVISDEIYEVLIYGKKHISIAGQGEKIKKLTVVVNGVSKAYCMTGWRIGYCAGETEIIQAASNLQDHLTSNPCSVAQKAALAALTGTKETILDMVKIFQTRRDLMYNKLKQINGIRLDKPDGAFYMFVDVSSLYNEKIKNSIDFCSRLLEEAKVAVIPGSAFGDDRYIRLSFAASEKDIEEAMDRIKEFAQGLVSE